MGSTGRSGIRIGVYGLNHPHAGGHFRDLDTVAGIATVLVSDADAQAAKDKADSLERGAYYAGGWEAMLADDDIPAVCLLTDNRAAGRLTREAMECGKWVYGDKPGAATAADMEAIVATGERTGTYFCPCYARRSYEDTAKMCELVHGGALGEIWSFQAVWSTSQVRLRGPENWLFDHEYAGGGIVYWLACHWLDNLRLLTRSRVAAVSAMTANMTPGVDVEEVVCANLRLENGAIGSLRAGYLRDPYLRYDEADLMMSLEGADGSLSCLYHEGGPTLRLRSKAPGFEYAAEGVRIGLAQKRPDGGYAPLLLGGFLEALENGSEPPATQHDALYVLKVAEAIYEAASSGTEQKISW
jgi:predicted dehydrogenase